MKDDAEFNLNLDELFAQLAEITQSSDINQQAYLYLLLLWAYFEVSMDEGNEGGDASGRIACSKPHIIQIEQAYQIFDYGTHLKTSAGKNYGSYSTGRLLVTVREMIKLMSERGAKKLKFAGLDAAQRFASLECEKYKIKVTNFTPDNKTQILHDRLPRLDSLRTSIAYTASK
ncbi:hypothetical protein [Rickettsiella endosymbiont of Aleochara curtula]|uniref:hypothetical protein n=1 Tax=Rickettsiella endosymbiont of Aleochara curtula TaxID=3077936 RepID=UPI00313C4607